MKVIFEVRDAEDGGFHARALGHAIFTGGANWNEVRNNIIEAVLLHFEELPVRPSIVQLHYCKDELISMELP